MAAGNGSHDLPIGPWATILGSNPLDIAPTPLGDDVRCAELASQPRAVVVTAHGDDPLRPESGCREHSAEPDGAVSDDHHHAPGSDLGRGGRVMAG